MHSTRLKLRDISRAAAIVIALVAGVPARPGTIECHQYHLRRSERAGRRYRGTAKPGDGRAAHPDARCVGTLCGQLHAAGRYAVRVLRAGTVEATQEVEALIGAGAEANFGPASAAGPVGQEQTVVVKASRNPIDVSNTNGVIFTAKELKALPVGNDVASIVQLTPGVSRGTNSVYGNAPSIGGSGQSRVLRQRLPHHEHPDPGGRVGTAVRRHLNMQVLSGGYGSEFGRSTAA
jgi:hypothetical protein